MVSNNLNDVTTPFTYTIKKSGTSSLALRGDTGKTYTSDPDFATVFDAVMSALATAGGGSLYIKEGTYSVATTLDGESASNVNLILTPNTILQTSAQQGTHGEQPLLDWYGTAGSHVSNVHIFGGHFNCNGLSGGIRTKWMDDSSLEQMHIYGGTHYYASGTLVKGINCLGSSGYENNNVDISRCHVNDFYGGGIVFSYAKNLNIHHNYVFDASQFYPGGGCINGDAGISDITINDNILGATSTYPTHNDGVYVGNSTTPGTAISILDNTIDLYCASHTTTPTDPSWASGIKAFATNSKISGNTITIRSDVTGALGIQLQGDHCDVDKNTIIGIGGSGNSPRAGIWLGADGSTAGNNNARNNTVHGDWLYGILILNGTTLYSSYNYLSHNDLSYLVFSGSVGLSIASGCNYNALVGGNFRGCTTDISDSGTGTIKQCYINKTGTYVA